MQRPAFTLGIYLASRARTLREKPLTSCNRTCKRSLRCYRRAAPLLEAVSLTGSSWPSPPSAILGSPLLFGKFSGKDLSDLSPEQGSLFRSGHPDDGPIHCK